METNHYFITCENFSTVFDSGPKKDFLVSAPVLCSRLVARSAVSGLSGGNAARSAASGRPDPRGSIPGGPRPRDQALALALYGVCL